MLNDAYAKSNVLITIQRHNGGQINREANKMLRVFIQTNALHTGTLIFSVHREVENVSGENEIHMHNSDHAHVFYLPSYQIMVRANENNIYVFV